VQGAFSLANRLFRVSSSCGNHTQRDPCALRAARKTPAVAGYTGYPDARETDELAFDSHKEAENYKPRVVSRIKRGQSARIGLA
jgi:hypothetical protein